MNSKDNDNADYDDLSLSESEFNDEEQRKFAKMFKEMREQKEAEYKKEKDRKYEDEPYKAKLEEEGNEDEQLENLQK